MPFDVLIGGMPQVNRDEWIEKQEAKGRKRRPRRVGVKQKAGTLFAKRNRNLAIREAALRRSEVILHYEKITTGERKKYIVHPYEWKFRMLKSGYRKVLYAYDREERRIKSFVNVNIQNVAIGDRKFLPIWPVRIK